MMSPEWHQSAEALALVFVRGAMTAAGIKHKHVSDAQLTDAIKKSSTPGVWVVDEEAAKEWVEFYNYYDFHWQLTRYEGMRSDASHPSTSPTRANGSSETSG